ncbi:transposase [Streptomyces sp. ME18-1-4]|nr:transposase [Streptomyces sp. ME18-1-4]
MKIAVQVKLLPSPDQALALKETLHVVNRAANWVSALAYMEQVTNKVALQHLAYARLKSEFGLSAQPALHVIRKVAGAYASLKANKRTGRHGRSGFERRARMETKPIMFRPSSAQPYDDRCLSWQMEDCTVSIWTIRGRLQGIPLTGSVAQLATIAEFRRGESDLVCRGGKWYLLATCEVPEAETVGNPADWLGVDLGIANIATTSDACMSFGGGELRDYRRRSQRVRAELQARGTKSAKRKLKHRSAREARHAAHVNHKIAKDIVAEAQRTGRGIGLEDLTGIRERARLRKPQRATFHCWSFAQLGRFIVYKAKRAGVPVVQVDPAYTSQRCSWCGHVERANRVSQELFVCRSCGVVAHADHNAARNIAWLAESVWGAVNRPHAAKPPHPVVSAAASPVPLGAGR